MLTISGGQEHDVAAFLRVHVSLYVALPLVSTSDARAYACLAHTH